jgi:hypothetical protein
MFTGCHDGSVSCPNIAFETRFQYGTLQRFVHVMHFLCQRGAPKCLLLMFMYTCEHNREIREQTVCSFYERCVRYILFHNRRSDALYRDAVSMELPFLKNSKLAALCLWRFRPKGAHCLIKVTLKRRKCMSCQPLQTYWDIPACRNAQREADKSGCACRTRVLHDVDLQVVLYKIKCYRTGKRAHKSVEN